MSPASWESARWSATCKPAPLRHRREGLRVVVVEMLKPRRQPVQFRQESAAFDA